MMTQCVNCKRRVSSVDVNAEGICRICSEPTRIATQIPEVYGSFDVYRGGMLVAHVDVCDKQIASKYTLTALHEAIGLVLKGKDGKEQQPACSEKQDSTQPREADDVSLW